MPRTLTVWCADWAAVAAGLDPDNPAAVVAHHRIVARTRAAAEAGVNLGQRRRQAHSICPTLTIVDADPGRDGRRFEPVVRAVAEIAPRVEVVAPGWLQLAARGPARYFGGEEATADHLVARIAEIEPSAMVGVGIADGQAAAAIAAHQAVAAGSAATIVPSGESAAYLSPLPISWLARIGEVEHDLVELFARLGLRHCGRLAAVPVADISSRFGEAGLHAHRLASAADERYLAPTDPPADRTVEHHFDTPVEQLDTLVFVGKRLADGFTTKLHAEGNMCARLEVVFESEHGECNQRLWYRDQGLDSSAIVQRLRWQLEGWTQQRGGITGGVVLIRLTPDEVRRADGFQGGLWGGRSQADDDAARVVVRLAGIAGEGAVCLPEWAGGRLPAERYRWVPAAGNDLDTDRVGPDGSPWPGALTPSPAVVYADPVPVEVLNSAGKIVGVTGRGEISDPPAVLIVDDRRCGVSAWAGPWPVEQRWWDTARSRRVARVQLVTDDGWAYLVGLEKGRWGMLAAYR